MRDNFLLGMLTFDDGIYRSDDENTPKIKFFIINLLMNKTFI